MNVLFQILLLLLVRGVTLPGSLDGIKFYVIPEWGKLTSLSIWIEAAMQIVFSSGAGWGAMISMASHNKFHMDCYKNTCIIVCVNAFTSIFSGLVVFSVVGFMAHTVGKDIKDVVDQGPGLVFVVYPAALASMPSSQLWSVLFFIMLFTLGLDSQFGTVELLMTCLLEELPYLFKTKLQRVTMRAVVCIVLFVLGIPCIMQGGVYVLQIMDWYSCTFSIMIVMISECLIVGWIYGVERHYRDVTSMIGYRPCAWWKFSWCFLTPAVIFAVFLTSLILHEPVTYGQYTYPTWAIIVGWLLALVSIMPLPLVAFNKILKAEGSIVERISFLLQPLADYGPSTALEQMKPLKEYPGLMSPL